MGLNTQPLTSLHGKKVELTQDEILGRSSDREDVDMQDFYYLFLYTIATLFLSLSSSQGRFTAS